MPGFVPDVWSGLVIGVSVLSLSIFTFKNTDIIVNIISHSHMQWMVLLCAFHPAFKTDLFNKGDRVEFFLSLRSPFPPRHTSHWGSRPEPSSFHSNGFWGQKKSISKLFASFKESFKNRLAAKTRIQLKNAFSITYCIIISIMFCSINLFLLLFRHIRSHFSEKQQVK